MLDASHVESCFTREVRAGNAAPPAPSTVEPLTADLRRLHVTVSKRFTQKLDAARDALSHSHSGADVETILEAGPLADGGICGSTHRVELDHVVPVGRGGRSTASQMRTLRKFHNDLAAREVYGDELMDRFTRGAGRPAAQHPARQP
jgi:hypothetical protein